MSRKRSDSDDIATNFEADYEVFQRAARLIDTGRSSEAEPLLKQLISGSAYWDEAQGLLALVFLDAGRAVEAVESFRELVRRRPDRESTSLGLFHALWQADRIDEAWAEMRRFRAKHESMEYRRLLRDLEADGLFPP